MNAYRRLKDRIRERGHRGIFLGSLHLLTGQVFRILIQSVYFILVTRALGAEEYGRYTSLQALLLGLAAFITLGYPALITRSVARDADSRVSIWSSGLRVTLFLGIIATTVVTMFGPAVLRIDIPRLVILLLAISELLIFGLICVFNGVLQGSERMERVARVLVALFFARLAVTGFTELVFDLNLLRFSIAHLIGSALALAFALIAYGRGWAWSLTPINLPSILRNIKDGFFIAIMGASRNYLLSIDKMLLPVMAGLAVAGQYAAGFRLVAFVLLPLQALMTALYPRFFQRGHHSHSGSFLLMRRVIPYTLVYAIPVSLIMYVAAPYLGPILGPHYPEVPLMLRHMIWLLPLQALYLPMGDALGGADQFGYRCSAMVVAVLANLGLNLFLIPTLDWRGAVLSAYISQTLLLLMYVVKIMRLRSSSLQPDPTV
ncbi:MAG: oligosaccharide flippase family protein [bacterium]|nr:oligosaccharide flippase family protein [bacterium]